MIVNETDGQSRGARQMGIRQARSQLSDLVRRAAAGERVVVTVDGAPMALLGPLTVSGAGPSLDDLATAGLVQSPRRRPGLGSGLHPTPEPLEMAVDVRIDRALDDLRG